ncbi:MAG TPA: glycosyltransferase [Candidatus Dormibacteraeota bacterium]|jgi:spore coat polysaccharide biosynthesis predicted glycosyltransferase SpsG|nr:glycosyltransferase [Candidatus Dormibacteraeota bacterium]
MKKIQIIFHDAGGGHRNAAIALQAMAKTQNRDWEVELVQFQELTDRLDVLRKVTGIRIQEQYNTILRNGWTWGSESLLRVLQLTIRIFHGPLVKLLESFWRTRPSDLLISVIPHFNREIAESWERVYPGRPFVTIITDLADFPPRFWIEPAKNQIVIAGTEKAVEQARALGKDDAHVFGVSGMVLRPEFYAESAVDATVVKKELGLREDLPTAMVLFGGFGSKVMYEIVEKLDAARLPVQLILICGKNEKLAARLKAKKWNIGMSVLGFTKEVHKLMRAADFLIGKPGPGSIAEAMQRGLPVLVECNSWTLPQERFNTEWVKEKKVGVVLKSFEDIVSGVQQMLEQAKLAEFKRNVAAQNNRAIFEIMEILARLLGENEKAALRSNKQAPLTASIV